MIFIIVCISLSNKKCFDTIDVRCEHEEAWCVVFDYERYTTTKLTKFLMYFVCHG
jgi:hypothetical protein